MQKQAGRILISLVLIVFGLAALLNNLGLINLPFVITGPNLIWTVIFGVLCVAFLVTFFGNPRSYWWAAIPGMTFLGLTILVGGLVPRPYENLGGAIFLGSIGLSFWIIVLARREFWWAIIPGGALLTLSLIAGLSSVTNSFVITSALFLGLAITFLLVYFLSNSDASRKQWALYPAAALGIMGILFLFGSGGMINILTSVAIIVAGGYLIIKAITK